MVDNIRILKHTEYEKWNEFVTNSPQGTIFHKSYWLETSGAEFRIYGYFKGEELFAGLPISSRISKLGVRSAGHPYLTPYLGILFKESRAKYVTRLSNEKEISRAIAARIKDEFDSINIKFAPFFNDLQPFIWEGFSSSVKYTYLLEFDDLNDIWDGMDAKRRNDITRAEKDGIYVVNSDDFEQTFRLVEKTFQRQKRDVIFKSVAFKYNEVLSQKGQCKSFLAKNKEGEAIAVVYIIWDEKRSYYLFGGYDSENSHHGASAIAMWKAIRFIKEELGLKQFDFEGSMIEVVEQFFRKFGGKLTPCYSAKWAKPSAKFAQNIGGFVVDILRKLHLL